MSVYLRVTNHVQDLKQLNFPYTPQIDYSTDVKYDAYNMVHTNYQLHGYTRTDPPQITLQCKFSAHTTEHFKLSHYAIRFLRTYTKMNYGRTDSMRGQTPRIMRFFAYGEQMFYDVPVVINKFNITFPDDVDYMKGYFDKNWKLVSNPIRDNSTPTTSVHQNFLETTTGSGRGSLGMPTAGPEEGVDVVMSVVNLPVYFQIGITLLVQQNLYDAVQTFNLNDFASGNLSSKGYI